MWQPLAANLTVTMLALMAWLVLGEQVARLSDSGQRLAFAGTMALSTLASMALSAEISPGVFLDFRAPLVAVAAFFGGWPAALVVAGVALAYRVWLGGALFVGICSILAAAWTGLAAHRLCRLRSVGMPCVAMMAVAMALNSLLVPLLLPATARAAWQEHMLVPVTLSALCTFVVGALLLFEKRRRELAKANMFYRSMVEALPDCLNIKDREGRFIVANEATATLMRAPSADALVGRSDADFYPADLAARFHADEERVMASERNETIEQERRFEDGTRGWLSTLKVPVVDAGGNVVGLVTHNRDITSAKLMQSRLDETQGHLDEALANMNDGLVMYDAKGSLLFCNRRYQDMFPLTAHLRVPGASFERIVLAALVLGEQQALPGLTVDAQARQERASLRTGGEHAIVIGDGRVVSVRTKVLESGCSLCVMSDVTERVRFEKDLEHRALHHPLTGLPNRACFNRELARLLGRAQAEDGELVVMLIDLDRFKQVNDTFGHPTGDALLVEVSRRLEQSVRQGDVVARLGGDEFAVLAYGRTNSTGDAGLANRIMKNVTQPTAAGEVTLMPGCTIGYTVFPRDPSEAEGLLKNADIALYQAKARRRGSWKEFDPAADLRPDGALQAQAG